MVGGGRERMRPDYVIERASYPFLTLEFVAEGKGSLELAGASFRLGRGMVFAYGPNMPHVIRTDPEDPMLKYYVTLSGKAAEVLLTKSPPLIGGARQLSSSQEVLELFEMLQRESGNDRRFGPQICAALLPVLIMKIEEHAFPYGTQEPRALETYQRVKGVLEREFLHLRTAEEAARRCHVNFSYLCRLFQRFAHTTPYQFMTKLKMNYAASLLLDKRMLVKEAAAALEFSDAFHFSRTFKRVYGIAPERFVRERQGSRVG